jgi:hypothetical protein
LLPKGLILVAPRPPEVPFRAVRALISLGETLMRPQAEPIRYRRVNGSAFALRRKKARTRSARDAPIALARLN